MQEDFKNKYKFDCLDFRGYKPCPPKKICDKCDEYKPLSKKILVIKLGALGDVMRTTPILYAFRRKDPRVHITWLTKKNAKEMLDSSGMINKLIFVDDADNGGVFRLLAEEFDEMHCYDKEDAAISLATLVKAKKKFGFHLNKQGHMAPINQSSEYCFDLGLSDDLKFFKNKKTYQEMTYECSDLEIPTPMDPYCFVLKPEDKQAADFVMKRLKWDSKRGGPVIGLNTGSGRVFRTKQWHEEYFSDLAKLLKKKLKARILLLGGEDEDSRNKRLATKLKGAAAYPGCGFSIRQFSALLEKCDAVVTGDTLAMHLALAVKTPTVTLFGSTCDQEVDLYGLGKKIVSRPSCAPCYKNECDQKDWMKCMREISPLQVFRAIEEVLEGDSFDPPKNLA